MTLDQLVLAAGLVEQVVIFDRLGRNYVGWLKHGEDFTAIVGADSCENAVLLLASRLNDWLHETQPLRAQQAIQILDFKPAADERPTSWDRLK